MDLLTAKTYRWMDWIYERLDIFAESILHVVLLTTS